MADTPEVGFDVLAARIRNIQYDIRPGYDSVKAAVSSSTRHVRGSFTKGLGKRASAAKEPDGRRRACAVVVTPPITLDNLSPPAFHSSPYIAPTNSYPSIRGVSPSGSMLIGDRDTTVPHHRYRRASVLQHVYKRLSPEDIVRLFPGDEIIIVIPAPRPESRNESNAIVESRRVIDCYRRAFSKVIDSTIKRSFAGDRSTLVSDSIDERHTFLREDNKFLEFEARASNYPLRERLESESFDMRSLDISWDQGAGINLSICGYTTRQTVLLQLRHVAYLEVYKLMPPDCFVTDSISFSANITKQEKLETPLVRQLSLFNGCPFSTMEILWKYYRSLSTAKDRRLNYVSKLLDASKNKKNPSEETTPYDEGDVVADGIHLNNLLSVVDFELSADRVNEFVGVVESAYKSSYISHYSGFHFVRCYLVDRRCITNMYGAMRRLFPFVHAVIATTVSNPRRDCVDIFNTETARAEERTDQAEDTHESEETHESFEGEGVSINDFEGEGVAIEDPTLSRRERAVLEFFIAKIRLRNQKTMKYWAMVPTLGTHSRGYMKTLPNHPVHGVGCSMVTLWTTLNEMFDSTTPGRMDVIQNQYTMSVAFDNWQQMIQKIWQTSGCSSNYLKGVASFAKKDKAVLLPVDSILKSPSGLRFRVLQAEFIDPYCTRVKGELLSGVDRVNPNQETGIQLEDGDYPSFGDGADYPSEEVIVGSGALVWPQIGWEVTSIPGMSTCAGVLSYTEPTIPPPMNACVRSSQSGLRLIFEKRKFCQSGERDSRIVTSSEYDKHIIDCEDIILLNAFKGTITRQHEWKKEIDRLRTEDPDVVQTDVIGDLMYDRLPHHFPNERVFFDHLEDCSWEVHKAIAFRSDMVAHLYPHSKKPDKYIHFPLIGRDETTNEGMMLTNNAILTNVGLLQKMDKGLYTIAENANKRFVFLYGDALSVSLHGKVYDKILRQITQLGNQEYIETLLSAQDRVVIQKGQFHQCMHHLATIYTQFYGGFLQVVQVCNGVKRVTGDPVKGGYQTHHHFAKKVYISCNRLMMRRFCQSGCLNEPVEFSDNAERIRWVLSKYQKYRDDWEQSNNEPSRMVALFMKSMRSYLRCKRAIKAHDGWHLEIESAHLLRIWKVFGKTTYLRLQCEFMEKFYDSAKLPPIYREIMRANAFCVKESGTAVAFDEENENYNAILKRAPVTPSLDLAIQRSRHVMIGDKAAREVWGMPQLRQNIRGTSLEEDIIDIEEFLHSCRVFDLNDSVKMHRDFFWTFVEPKIYVGSPRDKSKTTLPFDEHEQEFHRRVVVGESARDCNDMGIDAIDNSDELSVATIATNDDSICHSISEGVSANYDDEELQEDTDNTILTNEQRKDRISIAMKKLGNMTRKVLDKHATTDVFVKGGLLLGGQSKSRKKAIRKIECKRELIYASIKYFEGQLDERRARLEECILRSSNPNSRFIVPSYKQLYRQRMRGRLN